MPIKAIARVLGVGRNTVRRALAAEGPPKYRRSARGSKVDAVEPQIRELLRTYPRMPASLLPKALAPLLLILRAFLAYRAFLRLPGHG